MLSPDENTFEFWGDHEPQLISAGCTACGLTYSSTTAIPTKISQSIEAALADACIMQPLDD